MVHHAQYGNVWFSPVFRSIDLRNEVYLKMEEKVLDLLEEVCEDNAVRDDMELNLFEEDLLDSLAFTELLVAIEEQFGIVISPSEVERKDVETPAKIIELIRARS